MHSGWVRYSLPAEVAATRSLVSGEGSVEALTALILNATALLALVGAAIGNSTYYVGDYAVANYVV